MRRAFLDSLKACAQKKDLCEGSRIHADIRASGLLEKDPYLGNAVLSMYAKCGALARAQQVFDALLVRNAISWNALIAGYAQQGYGQEARRCFERMQTQGVPPNATTYACALKACGIVRDIGLGKQIHHDIASQGLLKKDIVLGNALVDMYAKCGVLSKAQEVFDTLLVRNAISWTALIAGYAQHGQGQEALGCFRKMRSQGVSPTPLTYTCVLKACGIVQDVGLGKQIHDDIVSQGLLNKNVVLGGALVDMHAKCGALSKAREVFDTLLVRNAIAWNALIAGYAQHGKGHEALGCFGQMQSQGFSPDSFTYACVLKACGTVQNVGLGKQIHDDIVSQGLLKKDVVLGNALVDMYAKCGKLLKAREVFDTLSVRNAITWTALIAGYAQHGQGQEALGCFRMMRSQGVSPNAFTYTCVLKACGIVQDVGMGNRIHDDIISQGLLKKDMVLGGALVDMHAKCGALSKAQEVFDSLPVRDAISWNALIAGYAQQGQGQEALGCFQRMRSQGVSPNATTYARALKACGITQDVGVGKQIHDDIVSQGLLKKDVVLGGALVDMYAKCGLLLRAQEVFDTLSLRNAIAWNALIAGYAQDGRGHEALGCFHRMQSQGVSPNAAIYACALKACGMVQDVGLGKQIHDEIASQGLLKKDLVLGNALVDMYAKCGALLKAQEVFDALPGRDAISWNSLIAGYAQHGQGQEALGCFQRMRSQGVPPNAITFLNILNACSHSGLIDEGQMCFDNMREKYGIPPSVEHYTCMVDLLGRARLFEKAMRVIGMMQSSDHLPLWSALLGACRKWGNVKLGRFAFERAVQLDQSCAMPYILMSNIYAAAGMQEEADSIECMRIGVAA